MKKFLWLSSAPNGDLAERQFDNGYAISSHYEHNAYWESWYDQNSNTNPFSIWLNDCSIGDVFRITQQKHIKAVYIRIK